MEIKLSNELTEKIKEYVEKNKCEMDWCGNDFYDCRDIIKSIGEKGLETYQDELQEMNDESLWEIETYYINELMEHFEDEFKEVKDFKELDEQEIKEYLKENFEIYCDLNFEGFLSNLPDIPVLIQIYSNYDCANSTDDPDETDETYLSEVYKPFKDVIDKKDFDYEFHNGCYGGALFVFVFKTDFKTYYDLKENFKTEITIPKNTQFGFHSSMNGASSPFEKTTHKEITIKKQYGNTEHDCINIVSDIEQSGYSIGEVFGSTNFINNQDVTVK